MIDAGNSYKDRVSRLISWGHWFLFANIILAIAMSVRYLFTKEVDDTVLSVIYLMTNLIGHFGLLGILSYIIILFPLTFIFPSSKAMRAIGAFVATAIIIALLIDGSVYQNYQLHLNLIVFDLAGFNLDNSIGWGTISLFLLAMLTVELTLANLIWKRLAIIRQWNIGNRLSGLFFGAFIISHLIHIWADATLYRPVLAYDNVLPLSHGSTARGLLKKYGLVVDENERQELNIGHNPTSISYPLRPLMCFDRQAIPNLLIINLATANADYVTPQYMPALSQLASQSIVAQEHISTSLDQKLASFNINTGLPSQYHDVFYAKDTPLLLELKSVEHQLTTINLTSSVAELMQRGAAQIDQEHTKALITALTAESVNGFIANITLYSSQELASPSNYDPAIHLDPKSNLNPPERVLARQYLRSLSYLDQLINSIITQVDLSKTTVVVTANRAMDLTAIYNSSNQFSKINLHVPLIISLPNTEPKIISKLSSHYDILPTLLQHHFKCANPASDYSVGNDLLGTYSSDYIYIGAHHEFAIYQRHQIAEINRRGDFRFYTPQYQAINNGHLPFQAIIDLMAKQRRFSR
ncbi:MAG: DUF3413 domain-containing protein [Gammaproteobacteria bacterium]|nr:DUF3413 domain-containing protein [Gammaproteobacteria bacterium]